MAFTPAATYHRLLDAATDRAGRRLVGRLGVVLLVIGIVVPAMAVQGVTVGLFTTAALAWSFVLAIQLVVGAAIISSASTRRIGMISALDLWFAAHLPYTLWMFAVSVVMATWRYASAELLIASAVAPAAWTAILVAAFCRVVFNTSRCGALWITSPVYHLIAVGLERTVNAFQSAVAAIDDVHAQGGVAIAAHPGRRSKGFNDEAISRLDGSERAHVAMHVSERARSELATFFERVRTLNPDVAPIGSSDFHLSPSLGRCRTLLFVRERTREGVLEAIRNGRTVAVDGDGRFYGRPELVTPAEQVPFRGRDYRHPIARRFALSLAWIGALVIVLFGRWS